MIGRVLVGALVAALLPLAAVASDGTIVGHDGKTYPAAPPVVEGRDGELFYGLTFDLFCSGAGPELQRGMKRLTKLTTLIRRSGRTVVFTVVPDKSLVNDENVITAHLPHGTCDTSGMREQRSILDGYGDPTYLPIRRGLAAEPKQAYWRTDLHWTTIGASVFAKALATRLSAPLGARQRYTKAPSQTEVGLLNQLRGVETPETVRAVAPDTGAKVIPRPGTDSLDQQFPIDHAWTSKPANLTYPGRTLLLGDSFTVMGLQSLRPIFRHGHFLWLINNPDEKVAKAIGRSDTVVIEVVQFFTGVSPLGKASFRRLVRNALG